MTSVYVVTEVFKGEPSCSWACVTPEQLARFVEEYGVPVAEAAYLRIERTDLNDMTIHRDEDGLIVAGGSPSRLIRGFTLAGEWVDTLPDEFAHA